MAKKRSAKVIRHPANSYFEDRPEDKPTGDKNPLKPQNRTQDAYIDAIARHTLTFGLGPAGTGKTYISTVMAADYLRDRQYSRIIVTRPVVEAGESLGFLPGELEEKFDPYFDPVRQIFLQRLGEGSTEYYLRRKKITALPLAYMRGHTFEDSLVILDEAQNTTPGQMKLFLTRIGRNSKVIVNGDLLQKDIKGLSGLADAVQRLRHVRNIAVVEFQRADIVRSGLVQKIVEAYETTE